MRRTSWTAGLAVSVALMGAAQAAPFAPYKDALFAYPEPAASLDGGRHLDVPYSERRDIDERDDIPERRVKRSYVDLGAIGPIQERSLDTADGPLRYAVVGTPATDGPILVFVHGRNGDRRLGMNDWSFGGNFNRLKNLLVRAGGAYVTLDGGRLTTDDAKRAGRLLADLRRDHSNSLLILACASMGGQICWSLATRAEAKTFDAMVLIGSDSRIHDIAALRRARGTAMPILIAHGTRDKVYAFDKQLAVFDGVRRTDPSYPIRFVGFEGGNHGTPVRMIDWRDTLNWIASEVSPASAR